MTDMQQAKDSLINKIVKGADAGDLLKFSTALSELCRAEAMELEIENERSKKDE